MGAQVRSRAGAIDDKTATGGRGKANPILQQGIQKLALLGARKRVREHGFRYSAQDRTDPAARGW